jgi:LysM repeat protein
LFCECLLTALPSVAAAKGKTQELNVSSGKQSSSKENRKAVSANLFHRSSHSTSRIARRDVRSSGAQKANSKSSAGTAAITEEKSKSSPPPVQTSVQTHRVKRGETLDFVAALYGTTEPVLVALNGLESEDSIRAGQFLFVPQKDKPSIPRIVPSNASYRPYLKPPKEKGYVELTTYKARFAGLVVDKSGKVRPAAVKAINDLLGAGGKHPPLPERLIRLLVKVSDEFGSRSIHVVSGYRTNSYYQDSRHRLSEAVDFTVLGVPNAVLCDYLRGLDDVGVGYYPNSTFVHLDTRKESAYWVDYAGPGEPPRTTPNAGRPKRGTKQWLLAELDTLVNQTKDSLDGKAQGAAASASAPTDAPAESPTVESEPSRAEGDEVASSNDSKEPITL